MTNQPLLQVKDLSLFYEDEPERTVLNHVSFELAKEENLLILGPSGCGKSTLTHCLNGLYPRELDGELAGTVHINGRCSTEFASGELAHHVGVVFQDPETQFCMLTVEDEIAFGLENKGVSPVLMEQKIDEVLALVNLSTYKGEVISTLSGGQKQKLALACMLALEPTILVLDEPTANLDPIASLEFIHTLERLQKVKKFSLIVIEHQLDGWIPLIDRSIFLNKDGKIFFDGNLRDGINHHRDHLNKYGIWIPQVTRIALDLENKGFNHYETLPLTVEELAMYPYPDNLFYSSNSSTSHGKLILYGEKLTWTRKKSKIIDCDSFAFYHGEFVTILGANGSGKSSFSKLLAGIEKPTIGEINLYGREMKDWKEKELRTKVGYVFQNPEHQFITDSVFEEVAFGLKLQGYNEQEIKACVKTVLTQCNLNDYVDYHPYTLSQGQKRRLSVATMIVDNQSILILDEPTFGQDAATTKELLQLLEQRRQTGTTIIMITHDMEIVDQYADRVLVMENGSIVHDSVPSKLWELPIEQLNKWQLDLPTKVKWLYQSQAGVDYVHS